MTKTAMMKPFDQDLFDADDNAKHQAIEYLETQGLIMRVNPDPYGIDLIGELDGQPRSYEIEVKRSWSGDHFQFHTVHIAARKIKFAKPEARFLMFNLERTHAFLITGDDVARSPIITKSTKYTEAEDFISVPLSRVTMIDLRMDDR
jgi:hypothetical protein